MALVEPVFLLFALIACLLYRFASRRDSLRPSVLVALSLFFYSTWNPWYCLPLTVTALLDYNTSWLLARTTNARVRSLLITTDITAESLHSCRIQVFQFSPRQCRAVLHILRARTCRPRLSAWSSWWGFPSTRFSR